MTRDHIDQPDRAGGGLTSLRIEAWPSDDRVRWLRTKVRAGRFDKDAILHDLAGPTVRGLEQSMGRFLAYVAGAQGLLADDSIGSALTPELVNDYAGFMRQRLRAGSVHEELRRLRTGFGILLPGRELGWINALPAAPSHAEVVASRKPIVRPDVARVLDSAYRVFDTLAASRLGTASCQAARNCLIVAFCALFEIRLKNLTGILLGEHMRKAGTRWRLMFLDDVKNDAPLLFDVPPELAKRLEVYLSTYRVTLLGGRAGHDALWIGRGGRPLLENAVAKGIENFSDAHLDSHLTSHVFRHAFAVTTITRNAGDADLAAAGLGHTSEQMVHGTYTRSGADEISRVWLKKLANKRKGR